MTAPPQTTPVRLRAAAEAAQDIPPILLGSYGHGIVLEEAAATISNMRQWIERACAELAAPPVVYAGDAYVPFATFNGAARFVRDVLGVDATLNAISMRVKRCAGVGAAAYGIRWWAYIGQPPGERRPGRKRKVIRLDVAKPYTRVMDAVREVAPPECHRHAAWMRITRAAATGKPAFGTRWAFG